MKPIAGLFVLTLLSATAGSANKPYVPLFCSPEFKPTPDRPVGWRGDRTGRFAGATSPTTWSRQVSGITTALRYQATKPSGKPLKESRPPEDLGVKDDPPVAAKPAIIAPEETKELAGDGKDDATKGKDETPLGSPKFHPSSERPVGWRGDGTGRYPGATPPVSWGRWVKGPFSQLRCQAAPSVGEPVKAEPLADGVPQEWLILGPYKVDDSTAAMGQELVSGEASLQPKSGDKQGDKTWVPYHMNIGTQTKDYEMLTVDLAKAYQQKTIEQQVAYATTSIYAKEPVKVGIMIEGGDRKKVAKVWLNGKPVAGEVIDLAQGWNRFLAKVGSVKAAWYLKIRLSPQAPFDYETRNVLWMTPMPGGSWSSPIIVGDKIFVSADQGVLVCVNKMDGKILWEKSTTWYDGLPEADRKAAQDQVEPVLKNIEQALAGLVQDSNAAVSKNGLSQNQFQALRRKIDDKNKLEENVIKVLQAQDRKRFAYWGQHTGTSHATPVSDGKTVCTHFWGGQKGYGASVLCAFDLSGKRKWAFFTEQTNVSEHGDHASTVMIGDRVFFTLGERLFALNKEDGKLLWKKKLNSHYPGGTGSRIQHGTEALLMDSNGHLFNPVDGKELGVWKGLYPFFTSIVVEKDIIYNLGGADGGCGFMAGRLTKPGGGEGAYTILFRTSGEEMIHPVRPGVWSNYAELFVASPLVVDGLVYCVTQGGILMVFDAGTGKPVYKKVLDLAPRLCWVFFVGVCASPAIAGSKYIYVTDDQGRTIVFEAGREFKQVSRNELTNYNSDRQHEQSQSSLVFEGSRMYYRSQGYLYCIGEE